MEMYERDRDRDREREREHERDGDRARDRDRDERERCGDCDREWDRHRGMRRPPLKMYTWVSGAVVVCGFSFIRISCVFCLFSHKLLLVWRFSELNKLCFF